MYGISSTRISSTRLLVSRAHMICSLLLMPSYSPFAISHSLVVCSVIVAAVVLHSKMMIYVWLSLMVAGRHTIAGSDDSLYLMGDCTLFFIPLCLYLMVPMLMYLLWLCLLCISWYFWAVDGLTKESIPTSRMQAYQLMFV